MGVNIRTIREIRKYLSEELKEYYPSSEIHALATLIIKTVSGISGLHQLSEIDQHLPEMKIRRIKEICRELKTGKPIQYILGETVFYDCKIKVNNETLIPRPETEELVDLILRENPGYKGSILDAGTGSGCIAIALSKNLPGAEVTAIDSSEKALKLAAENAELNNVKITFRYGDILNFKTALHAGIIVSNPPYVRESEKKNMDRNVLEYEPHTALFVPDSDPLVFYRAILEIAPRILVPPRKVYFEINEAMGKAMHELFETFNFSAIRTFRDINGKVRIIKGTENG